MPRAIVSYLVGLPQANVWSHAGRVECGRQANLIYVVSLTGSSASQLGQTLVSRLDDIKMSGAADLYGFIQQLSEQAIRQDCQLSLAGVLTTEQKLVLATWRSSVILRRQKVASRLLSSQNQIGILEGVWQKDDVLVISTAGANHYQTELCQRLADGFEINVIRQAINSEIGRDNQSAGIALSFITPQLNQATSPTQVTLPAPVKPPDKVKEPSIDDVEPETMTDTLNQDTDQTLSSSSVDDDFSTPDNPPESAFKSELQSRRHWLVGVKWPSLSLQFFIRIWAWLRFGMSQLTRFKPGNLQISWRTVSHVFTQVKSQASWLWQVITGQKIYLSSAPTKPRRLIFLAILAGLVFVILILSVWIWRGQNQALAQLAPMILAREQIESLTDSDVFQARTQAINLRSELSLVATASSVDSSVAQLARKELTKVDQILLDLAQKTELKELPVYLDLSSVESGFVAQLSAAAASEAGLLDMGQKKLIRLNLSDKSTTISPADTASSAAGMVYIGNNTAAILSDGIWSLVDSKTTRLIEASDANRDANLLASFDDTIYVFNPVKRNIFRYNRSSSGYSKPVGWLVEPLGAEFENIVAMAVDDQVWLGTNQGQILLFKAGRAQAFTIQGLSQPLTNITSLTTRPGMSNLYVLDSQNARVLVINKQSGQLQREVVSLSLKSASNLLVSDRGVYGVSGSLIYQLPD